MENLENVLEKSRLLKDSEKLKILMANSLIYDDIKYILNNYNLTIISYHENPDKLILDSIEMTFVSFLTNIEKLKENQIRINNLSADTMIIYCTQQIDENLNQLFKGDFDVRNINSDILRKILASTNDSINNLAHKNLSFDNKAKVVKKYAHTIDDLITTDNIFNLNKKDNIINAASKGFEVSLNEQYAEHLVSNVREHVLKMLVSEYYQNTLLNSSYKLKEFNDTLNNIEKVVFEINLSFLVAYGKYITLNENLKRVNLINLETNLIPLQCENISNVVLDRFYNYDLHDDSKKKRK